MFKNSHLKQGIDVLNHLSKEHINTPQEGYFSDQDDVFCSLRQKTFETARQYPSPKLVMCVAMTLLKVSACQELSVRFMLEYYNRTHSSNLSVIYLGNINNLSLENHAVVFIGSVNPSGMLIPFNAQTWGVQLKMDSPLLSTNDFMLSQDHAVVLVDPLLMEARSIKDTPGKFNEYCQKHRLTHLLGVQSFAEILPSLNITQINENAQRVAATIRLSNPCNLSFFSSSSRTGLDALLGEISLSCDDRSVTQAIADHQYSLLLRKLCSGGKYGWVQKILSHKNDLKIEINQPSTNGKTALDWLDSRTDQSPIKENTRRLLCESGALNRVLTASAHDVSHAHGVQQKA